MTKKRHTTAYPAELRERGVRFFRENRADYASDTAATTPLTKTDTRPPVSQMIMFIDDHRRAHGVDPIHRTAGRGWD